MTMKKILFQSLIVYIFSNICIHHLFSQNCNLEKDKKDDFTGELLRTSKQLVHKKGNNKKIGMYIKRVNDDYEIEINIIVSTAVQWISGKNYRCDDDDRLLIKLKNEEVVMLPIKSWNSRWEQPSLGKRIVLGAYAYLSKDYKYFFELKYDMTKEDISKLSSSEMIKMRIELMGYNNNTNKSYENIEFEILPEYGKNVLNDAKCIIR